MLEAEMMVRAQAQSLIQGWNTQIPTMFPHGEGANSEQCKCNGVKLKMQWWGFLV